MPVATLLPILERIKASREQARARVLHPARARSMKLRTYQLEDVQWLRETKRGILGWAPGLGKTFGACEAAELPVLVTCPLPLTEQWASFIQDQYPADRVVVASKGDLIKRDAALKQPFDWMIVNHDMFRTYPMPAAKTLIVDEMHHFRNRGAARSKNLKVYATLTPRVYGLTATPVYKDVGDLWHQLNILDPKTWTSYYSFLNTYAVTSSTGFGGAKVISTRNERLLRTKIAPYIKERTYKQVGMFLPDRIDKHVVLNMDAALRSVYNKLRDFYRLELAGMDEPQRFTNAGAVLHMLRKILVTDEKLDAIREIVDDTPAEQPVIVFVWYKDTAKKVADALDGIEITGEDSPVRRRELALTGGPEHKRVRVATMASLSEGVDLSEARTVIFVEEDYVPGKNYQAMSRVQRFSTTGERAPIIAYWVRYAQSIDTIVHERSRSRTSGNALSVLKEALEEA